MAPQPSVFLLGVVQPLAWAVSVRNCPVVCTITPPPPELLGRHVALCSRGGYDEDLRQRIATQHGVNPPAMEEAAGNSILAVGRVLRIGPPVPGIRGGQWYTGPHGLWLAHLVTLVQPLPCMPPEDDWGPVPQEVLSPLRDAWREAFALTSGIVQLREVDGLEAGARLQHVKKAVEDMQRVNPEAYRDLRHRFLGEAVTG